MPSNLENTDYHESAYQIYELIVKLKKDGSIHAQVARGILQDAMSCFGTWQVVGITPKAWELFANADFQRPNGLHRAHLVARKEIYDELLDGEITQAGLAGFLAVREKTIICIRGENTGILDENCYAIDPKLGMFRPLYKGFYFHTDNEGNFLRTLKDKRQPILVRSLLCVTETK